MASIFPQNPAGLQIAQRDAEIRMLQREVLDLGVKWRLCRTMEMLSVAGLNNGN